MQSDALPLWLPQKRLVTGVTESIVAGHRRICAVLPTGGGKSRASCELINDWLVCGHKVSLYTNRKMLIEQLAKVLSAFGLDHGLRTADAIAHNKLPSDCPLQISSVQTESSRVLKKKTWQLHPATRVLIDEAHLNSGDQAKMLVDRHLELGAAVVGMTATPIDLAHFYDHLVVGGTNSELRECGALVLAKHKGCAEPDTRKIKKSTVELTGNDIRKIVNVQHIVGHVFSEFNEYNPDRRPTILFAPGVAESIWFCEQFRAAGIEAAHIDGQTCVYKGERYDSKGEGGKEIRNEIIRAWRAGEVKVVCNRFVLREGIDAPFIEHMILATIMSSLQSYLQSVGRGLRASPSTGKTHLTIQDHGGHWWRHGSVNQNREWSLEDTERSIAGKREERLRNKKETGEREPCRCPKCGQIVMTNRCPCGFEIGTRSRIVIQEDGKISEHKGEIFKPRVTKAEPNTAKLWERMYWRFRKNGDRTFTQARGMFYRENGYWPPPDLPFMPKNESDLFRRVKDVPREALR
jgi:superfamily II DNA or RNA helicase